MSTRRCANEPGRPMRSQQISSRDSSSASQQETFQNMTISEIDRAQQPICEIQSRWTSLESSTLFDARLPANKPAFIDQYRGCCSVRLANVSETCKLCLIRAWLDVGNLPSLANCGGLCRKLEHIRPEARRALKGSEGLERISADTRVTCQPCQQLSLCQYLLNRAREASMNRGHML